MAAIQTTGINQNKRFAETSTEELNRSLENSVPENTKNKSKWAMNIFWKWLSEWRVRIDDDILKVLKEVEEFSKDDLDYCLQYFYSNLRKGSGERYPPQTQEVLQLEFNFILTTFSIGKFHCSMTMIS